MIRQNESIDGEQQPGTTEFDSSDGQVSLPADEQLQLYYDRRLPQHVLDQFDINCVRYRNWQQAVGEIALRKLITLTCPATKLACKSN